MEERDQQLVDLARPLVTNLILSRDDRSAASVAAAIRSASGKTYTGICIDLSCSMGFCAEHAAAAEMIKGGETRIESIVAVSEDEILTPCGRCREFLVQVDAGNADAWVILGEHDKVQLRELLPRHWLIPPLEERE